MPRILYYRSSQLALEVGKGARAQVENQADELSLYGLCKRIYADILYLRI